MNSTGPITNEAANNDLLQQAMEDIAAFRDVINPELRGKFDSITDTLDNADGAVVLRVLILAVSFGRRLGKGEKPKLILPPHLQ